MIARKLYDNKTIEVNNAPRWLKTMFKEVTFIFLKDICYGFKKYDSKIGATQDVTYFINGELYVSYAIMSISQYDRLNETHSRCDGFIQVSIFDL